MTILFRFWWTWGGLLVDSASGSYSFNPLSYLSPPRKDAWCRLAIKMVDRYKDLEIALLATDYCFICKARPGSEEHGRAVRIYQNTFLGA